ncbi:primosomal protein N' [Sphingorhabdus lutea]|uniref:Replication restart protein PriA n=1 Tax=Sphingorhabdus lutea TaxID=1913578 RepID=A0A1L3JD18_9SPHN|nr:primosomal protein N' [Sphingorhabdus lutea]APG63025.1 primosomal protein N' [Sphingorhabdus lutea]
MNRITVITRNAALGPLDYRIDDEQQIAMGSLVRVPLGPRQIDGIVWDREMVEVNPVPDHKLRKIIAIADVPPISAPLRRLADWVSDYYVAPLPSILRMVMPSSYALDNARTITEYRANGVLPDRMTPKRAAALDAIADAEGTISELGRIGGVSEAVIRGLIKSGCFDAEQVSIDRPFDLPNPQFAQPKLNEYQAEAAYKMVEQVKAQKFACQMLDGVTGSGKTETYFEAVAEAFLQGKQVLILLPEIALTEPFLDRFEARFGVRPASWHSGMKSTQRRRTWHAIANGSAMALVGARSALFMPFTNLGLIIVDEAHEASFKQEDGVRYQARDTAIMRAMKENVPIILASATHAIETRYMAQLGKYETLTLPSRFGPAKMPSIKSVDLTSEPPERGRWIAPTLLKEIEQRLDMGEQSLLFLNRRGYAPLTLCRTCGTRIECPNCSSWMVEHRFTHRLACHHCGHAMPIPKNCPECDEQDSLVACGPGVERIADEVRDLFPDARTIVATSDTLYSQDRAAEFVRRVEAHEVDIIIGTQLVTKGYHFPDLTLVGIIDADLGLAGGDLRAAERTFQQISQAAGRAGRGAKHGEVYLQSHNPSNPVLQAIVAGDREGFYEQETLSRKSAGAPPFGRLAAIIISSEDEAEAISISRAIGAAAPKIDDLHIYGPAPAPLSMLRGRYRQRLLVQANRQIELQNILRSWIYALEWPRSVRVNIDIDPYNFM